MLTRVAPGQVRFGVPGLSADGRGVALGREVLARFQTLDRLVGFVRLLTAEQRLDDVVAGMRLGFARAAGGTREVLVTLPCLSSDFAELVARSARLAGGGAFTGSGRHFVPVHDGRSALGYDVSQVSNESADVLLYAEDRTLAYRFEGELSLTKLVLRLPLLRDPARPEGLQINAPPPVVFLVARHGLGPPLLRQLSRAGVPASAAPFEDAPGAVGSPGRFWLFRVESPPARMWALLRRTPGIEAFVPVGRRAAVAVGHHHPIHLEACESVLGGDRLVLFAPGPTSVRVLSPAPTLVAIGDLVRLAVPRVQDVTPTVAQSSAPARLETPLRLVRAADAGSPVTAALVPWERVRWLLRLCYALPAPALRGHRIAFLEAGALIVAQDGVQGMPFASLYTFAAPGVLVPVGTTFSPAASPTLVGERLGTGDGSLVLFPARDAAPLRIPPGLLERLERRVLAGLAERLPSATTLLGAAIPAGAATAPEVMMDSLGFMPLWGLTPPSKQP